MLINNDNSLDQLLGDFTPQENHQEPTPEERDEARLEQDIERTFNSRRLTNNLLITLLLSAGNIGSIHFLMRMGLPAIGGTLLGGIVAVISFGNALTKISIRDGYPHFGKDFAIALAQTGCVGSSVWFGTKEHRQLSGAAKQGQKAFVQEVEDTYYAHLHPQDSPWFLGGGVAAGLGILLIIGIILGRKTNGGY
ncbi:MAG: hypothetical protein F6J89_14435 [Symploca sp. SIO1C4]|uniref:Uncharacterized protein n=1 Tax=Symploca sp. SIO1C4 TaxID=2607765 RepID=A0A6B3NB94_9CYAN|nr:hypothetical protein [Symploca sp. SIO1C4]